MGVVRSRDEHGIDVLRHGVEHLAEVLEALGFGEFPMAVSGAAVIHITKGHDVFPGHAPEVSSTLTTAADHRQADFVGRRRLIALGADHMGRDKLKAKSGSSGIGDKGSAFHDEE